MAEMPRLQGNFLCPKPQKKLDEYKKQVRFCTPTYNGAREFQVKAAGGKIFLVDLWKRICACGHWQLFGIPCPHAISCMCFNKEQPEKYVDACYHLNTGMRAYSFVIHPLNDSSQW
ncbi:hypothetical protein LINPERPRIM_LOCUS30682, partial [Linum perenne]